MTSTHNSVTSSLNRDPRLGPTEEFDTLRSDLLSSRALYADNQFPANIRSIYQDGRVPPDSGHKGRIVWKRPTDMYENPVLFINNARRHDLDQGMLGDCWFIAGAAVLATSHGDMFSKVVPPNQGFDRNEYTGMFRFNFWWYGKWKEIIIDDYLPTDGYRLIYCSNRERPNEFWPCLLEKAYAKLRGSYSNLNGGKMQDAMVDMTGGISEVIDLKDKSNVSPDLYALLYKSHHMKTMMGACIFKTEKSEEFEVLLPNGLYMGHAYSITGFKQLLSNHGNVNLLRIRNPWGMKEWNGPWSDGSPEMNYLSKELQEELRFRNRDDGEFWISYEDFLSNFDEIQLCHLQPDALISELGDNIRHQDWMVTVYHDAWIKGVTAGGCGNRPHERLYWKNPQFFVTLKQPDTTLGHGDDCTLIISLMEKEKDNKSHVAVGFDVYKIRDPDFKPLDDSRVHKNALLLTKRSGSYVYYREVTKRFELRPGNYVILPSTFHPHEEAQFMLRLFTEKLADSGVLDEDVTPPPVEPDRKDPFTETFDKHAGKDKRLDPKELAALLEDLSTEELKDPIVFPLESCRSLVTLMDENKSGYLGFSETQRAWKEIKAYWDVFKQFDADNTNSVDTYELGTMFSKLGFPVSRGVLTSIVRRYGGRNNHISLPDFIMVICKLTSYYASFHTQQRKTGRTDNTAEFTRNEFLQVTMLI